MINLPDQFNHQVHKGYSKEHKENIVFKPFVTFVQFLSDPLW